MWTTDGREEGRAHGTCAVTGTSGYVGSRVAGRLAQAGWNIRALARTAPNGKHAEPPWTHFELGRTPARASLASADALVHAAYDFDLNRWPDIRAVNVEGSRRLVAAAREAGIGPIVVVSTVAAFPGARSLYGRAKLEIERAALDAGAAVVRPGLVWGPHGAAMFGALRQAIERLPIVPLPAPMGLELSLVHEDDLALLVERLLRSWPQGAGKLLVAASRQTPTFGELLRSLALAAGRRPRFVRLPWRTAWLGLRALEGLGLRPPFRSDSLVSLVAIDSDPLARATERAESYGVRFRPYAGV